MAELHLWPHWYSSASCASCRPKSALPCGVLICRLTGEQCYRRAVASPPATPVSYSTGPGKGEVAYRASLVSWSHGVHGAMHEWSRRRRGRGMVGVGARGVGLVGAQLHARESGDRNRHRVHRHRVHVGEWVEWRDHRRPSLTLYLRIKFCHYPCGLWARCQ